VIKKRLYFASFDEGWFCERNLHGHHIT